MKQKISLIALLLSVVMMAAPAFAAAAPAAAPAEAETTEAAAETATEATAETATEAAAETATEATAATEASTTVAAEDATPAAPTAAPAAVNADAKALYDAVVAKMDALRSVEMNGSMQVSMNVAGQDIDVLSGITMREIIEDDKIQMETNVRVPDYGIVTKTYYKDGYLYQLAGGTRVKTRMNIEDIENASYDLNKELTDDMFIGATMQRLENGNTRINCTLSADSMNALTADALSDLFEGMEITDATVAYGDIRYGMEVDPYANLVGYQMNYAATVTLGGETITATYAVALKVVDTNHLFAIGYPQNLDDYVEMPLAAVPAAA